MNAPEVRKVVKDWIADRITGVDLGLPEYDDRKGVWCVALVTQHNGTEPVGEVRVLHGEVIFSSNLELVAKRIKRTVHKPKRESKNKSISFRPLSPTADGTSGVGDSLASSTTENPQYQAGGQGHSHYGVGSFLQSLGVDVTASPGSAVALPSQDEPVLVPQTRPCRAQTDDGTPCENQVSPTSTKCSAGHTPLPRAT